MQGSGLKIVGYAAVGLAFAGVALPLLPTTPFLLLALWCFSKSSPRMQRWLLENRTFGPYLRNYQAGRGVPQGVKAAALVTLWSSVLLTALLWQGSRWIPAGLLVMALLVSIHILRIKTMQKKSDILVLFPTEPEGRKFTAQLPAGVRVGIVGVGPYRCAVNTLRLIGAHHPRRVILAGIAGAYPESGLASGDTVLVATEQAADLGSFGPEGFEPKFAERLACPHLPKQSRFRSVASNSLSAAAAPYADTSLAQIENMEGAAFFYACSDAGVPFLELRTVSNRVGEPFAAWDIEGATDRLAEALHTLIDEIESDETEA